MYKERGIWNRLHLQFFHGQDDVKLFYQTLARDYEDHSLSLCQATQATIKIMKMSGSLALLVGVAKIFTISI